MALNVKVAVYRGTLANLSALATTGQAGVLAWTTDTNEIYVDAGSGSAGIGSGNAWQKIVSDVFSVNAQSGASYTIAASDRGKLVTFNNAGAVAVTLPVATGAGFPAGWYSEFENIGAGTVTITPTTSQINGGATVTLKQYQSIKVISDATNYWALTGKTAVAVTNAVSHNFATSNNADGSLNLAQPAFTDISGTMTQAQLPATINSGSNLTLLDCGTF